MALQNAAWAFALVILDTAPWMVLGFILAGLVNTYVPKQILVKWLGGPGVLPVLRAAVIGSLLPICSCGIVPIGLGLYRRGASPGATLAFLIASPALSPASAVMMAGKLGLPMAVSYSVAVVITALTVGLMANLGPISRWLRPPRSLPVGGSEDAVPDRSLKGALRWGLLDYGSEMSLDILFGLLVASAIAAWAPREWIGSLLGAPFLSTYLLVALLAAPLYVCTMPSIPVIRTLIDAGMAPGAGITYLLSGSATNLGELRALSRRISPRMAWVFFISMVIAGPLAGYAVDWIGGTRAKLGRSAWLTQLMAADEVSPSSWSFLELSWSGLGTAVLAVCLVHGIGTHLRSLWQSPCQTCSFWSREVGGQTFSRCPKACWVLKLQRWIKREPLFG